jgi:hypothetical protein
MHDPSLQAIEPNSLHAHVYLLLLGGPRVDNRLDDRRVSQRGDVPEIVEQARASCNLPQNATHDLPRAGLGESCGDKVDDVWGGKGSDVMPHLGIAV